MTVAILATILAVPALADEGEFEVLDQEVLKLAADKAKISARQAIEAAMREAGEAKLIKVELDLEGDRPVFELGFRTGTGELKIVVDAVSGKVLKQEREKDAEVEDDAEASEHVLKMINAAKITLTQAIEAALREVRGGTVVEAEAVFVFTTVLETKTLGGLRAGDRNEIEWEVELLAGGVFKEIELDADGRVKEV